MRENLLDPEMRPREVASQSGASLSNKSKVRARLSELGDSSLSPQRSHVPLRRASFSEALRARYVGISAE